MHMNDPVKTKKCMSCWGMYPVDFYSLSVYTKDNYRPECKACRAQAFRINRKIKYNAKSHQDDSIIRSVTLQNKQVLANAFTDKRYECIGWCPHNGQVFKVVFGDAKYSVNSLAFFSTDGSVYRVFEHSGGDTALEQITAILRIQKIRLEFSEADMINSKQTIYLL